MAALVGEQVARYRRRQVLEFGDDGQQRLTEPLTLQDLSDRCAVLGYPIARSVISKLEKGHRHTVTVDEVQILAAALKVPAVLLLFPLGYAGTVEVLPGREVDPWGAIEWFTGNSEDPADSSAPPQLGTHSPLILWGEHGGHDRLIPVLYRQWQDAKPQESSLRELTEPFLQNTITALRRIRGAIEELGLTPPAMHPETVRILAEDTAAGTGGISRVLASQRLRGRGEEADDGSR